MISSPHLTPAKTGTKMLPKSDAQSPQASASTNSAIRAMSSVTDGVSQENSAESSTVDVRVKFPADEITHDVRDDGAGNAKPLRRDTSNHPAPCSGPLLPRQPYPVQPPMDLPRSHPRRLLIRELTHADIALGQALYELSALSRRDGIDREADRAKLDDAAEVVAGLLRELQPEQS